MKDELISEKLMNTAVVLNPPNSQHVTLDALSSSGSYFYKMLTRWSALLTSLEQPNKEAGYNNIERFHGISNHLLKLSIDQRSYLEATCNTLTKISSFIASIEQLDKGRVT